MASRQTLSCSSSNRLTLAPASSSQYTHARTSAKRWYTDARDAGIDPEPDQIRPFQGL